jgi:hypothetical protein
VFPVRKPKRFLLAEAPAFLGFPTSSRADPCKPARVSVDRFSKTALGPRPDVSEFSCVATQYPLPACGILTTYPFALDNVVAGLPVGLGPSHS